MGLHTMGSVSSYSSYDKKERVIDRVDKEMIEKIIQNSVGVKKLPNPDPMNWILNKSEEIGNYLIVDITYPDCVNYEGRKIMLYEGVTVKKLKAQKSLDPHFSSNKKFYSPIARFEPTEYGWEMAEKLAGMLK